MRKAPLVLAAAAVLGLTAVAAPSPAEARYWRGGGGFFPAVAGGLIAGAVIGGLASNAYAYGPGYGYYDGYGSGYYGGGYAPAYYGGYYGGGYAPAYYGGILRRSRGSLSSRNPPGIRLLWRSTVLWGLPWLLPWLVIGSRSAANTVSASREAVVR